MRVSHRGFGTIMTVAALAAAGAGAQERAMARNVATVPSGTTSAAARNHLAQGVREVDLGRPRLGKVHFEAALREDPTWGYAHLRLAFVSNTAAERRTHLQHAADHSATATEEERLLIEADRKGADGDVEARVRATTRLTEIAPGNARAWVNHGNALVAASRDSAARDAFRKAHELAPTMAVTHVALINNYLFREPRDLAAAERLARRFVELEPAAGIAHDLLGDSYRAQGKLALARDAYARQARVERSNALGYVQRGLVHMYMGDSRRAQIDFDSAYAREDKDARPGIFTTRANAYLFAGDYNGAIAEFERGIQAVDTIGPADPSATKLAFARNAMGVAVVSGNLGTAQRILEIVRTLNQDRAQVIGTPAARRQATTDVLYWEGEIAARSGQFDVARAKANESMVANASDPNPRRDDAAHYLLGLTDLLQGRPADAIPHLEQAKGSNLYVTHQYAIALHEAGRAAEARPYFERVANDYFSNVATLLVRADARRRLGLR